MKVAFSIFAAAMLLGSTVSLAQTVPDTPPVLTDDSTRPSPEQSTGWRMRRFIEILSDTKGMDFGPYARQVLRATQQNWRDLTADSSRYSVMQPIEVGVEFSVRRDGSIDGLKIVESSDNPILNQAAQDAIKNSSPLPTLPANFPEDAIKLRVFFHPQLHQEGSAAGTTGCCPPDEENGVYRAGRGGVSIPKRIYTPDPEYTDKSRKAKLQGTVILELVVTAEGTTRDITVQKSLSPDLDKSAIKTVSRWKFEPGMKDGQPVPVKLALEVDFKLY